MALTKEHEDWIVKKKQVEDLENEIEAINQQANIDRGALQAQIETVEQKRLTDVKAKEDSIESLG